MKRLQLTVMTGFFVCCCFGGVHANADLVFNQGDEGSLTLTGIIQQVRITDAVVSGNLQRTFAVTASADFRNYTGGFAPADLPANAFIGTTVGDPFSGDTRFLLPNLPFELGPDGLPFTSDDLPSDLILIPIAFSTILSVSHTRLNPRIFSSGDYDFAQLTFTGDGGFDPCCSDVSIPLGIEISFLTSQGGAVIGTISGSVNAIPEPGSFALLCVAFGVAGAMVILRPRFKQGGD